MVNNILKKIFLIETKQVKNLSEQDVWDRLIEKGGFTNPDDYALNRIEQNLKEFKVLFDSSKLVLRDLDIGSGKTFKIEVSAVSELSKPNKKVVVYGHNTRYAVNLGIDIRRLAFSIGVDPQNLECRPIRMFRVGEFDDDDTVEIFDHNCCLNTALREQIPVLKRYLKGDENGW